MDGAQQLLIGGVETIDVQDWEAHTDYRGYTATDQVVRWFWQVRPSFPSSSHPLSADAPSRRPSNPGRPRNARVSSNSQRARAGPLRTGSATCRGATGRGGSRLRRRWEGGRGRCLRVIRCVCEDSLWMLVQDGRLSVPCRGLQCFNRIDLPPYESLEMYAPSLSSRLPPLLTFSLTRSHGTQSRIETPFRTRRRRKRVPCRVTRAPTLGQVESTLPLRLLFLRLLSTSGTSAHLPPHLDNACRSQPTHSLRDHPRRLDSTLSPLAFPSFSPLFNILQTPFALLHPSPRFANSIRAATRRTQESASPFSSGFRTQELPTHLSSFFSRSVPVRRDRGTGIFISLHDSCE